MHYLFVNFKTYKEGTGKNALSLAKLLASFHDGAVQIIPVVQSVDLKEISSVVPLNIFSQHIDPVNYGSNTGHVLPESIKEAGAFGTVLNHAENKKDNEFIGLAVKRARDVGLKVMLCAESINRAKQLAEFNPDFIAIEPPELIGGDVSVSNAKPELISDSVSVLKKINPKIIVITGAGIKGAVDVSKAVELGTKGVFVASGIVCADNKESAIRDLLSGFPARDSSKLEP
ncbi:MAG: triose-phosphate isomerase [Candidatus Diapherotrites archaeon CG11_big_fil_rev_8_21_14_0_20_37_9]|nr:MAG: triose-phosphate isomerase [Candidatus Diapherotrites archaeon CG11_big_fil_rev_8_21_14_0_20_37_9]